MATAASIWFVNATADHTALAEVCRQAGQAGQLVHILYRRRDRDAVLSTIPPDEQLIRPVELPDTGFDFAGPKIDPNAEIFFLPCSPVIDWNDLRQRTPLDHPHCIQPLVANPPRVNPRRYLTGPVGWFGWRARGDLARRILREPSAWQTNGIELVERIQHWPDPPRWQSIPLTVAGSDHYPVTSPPRLTMASSVLAVLSFYRCEEWLHAALTSMTQQTRPAENIVVIDDCSGALPVELVEPFPNVTLLSTTRNIGPEKILNNIIKQTDYDAYMVQDADDWSSHDRLELSLQAAQHSGADLVASHEFCVDHSKEKLELCVYPPDVNDAMSGETAHHVLQTASLFSRGLAMKIGGFDDRLKLGADTDFAARACHAGRLINFGSFCIFRRVRAASLTTDDKTGYRSAARMIERRFIMVRSARYQQTTRIGQTPNVVVTASEPPADFVHHCGPKLRSVMV